MKTLFISLLVLNSLSAFALDCKMYEGKKGEDLSGRTFRFTEEVSLEKELACAGHCLYIKNEVVDGVLRVSDKSASLITNWDGIELVANADLVKGKLDLIKQSVKINILGETADYSVMCTDL